MTQETGERPVGRVRRSTLGSALRLARSRRAARIVMTAGLVVSLVALAAALVLTTSGVAVGVFLGILLLSCAISCLIAWLVSERAARDLAEQVEELARRRRAVSHGGSNS